jgi:hypothetical protein
MRALVGFCLGLLWVPGVYGNSTDEKLASQNRLRVESFWRKIETFQSLALSGAIMRWVFWLNI